MDERKETNDIPAQSECSPSKRCSWVRASLLMMFSAALGGTSVFFLLRELSPPQDPALIPSLGRLEADVAKLNQQIKEIVPLGIRVAELESHVQTLDQQGDALEQLLKQTPAAPQLQEMLTHLKQRLEDMATQTQTLRQSQHTEHLLTHLQTTLGKGMPLGATLDTLAQAATGNPTLGELVTLLAPYRDQAPPTLESLRTDFKNFAQETTLPATGNLWDRLKEHLQNLIVLEPKDFSTLKEPKPAQIMAHIQGLLAQGHVGEALQVFDRLDQHLRTQGGDWYINAQAYLRIHTALENATPEAQT